MNPGHIPCRTRRGPSLGIRCLALAVAFAGLGCPQVAVTADPSSPSGSTINLEYRTAANPVTRLVVNSRIQTGPFSKEPALSGRVYRGKLAFAPTDLGFIWNSGRLYLDLNGNGDLTDDPAGVYANSIAGYGSYQQSFTNIDLALASRNGRRLLLNLTCYAYGNNNPTFTAEIRSYWAGKILLQDAEWETGLVENPSSTDAATGTTTMFLRPWSEQQQPLVTDDGSLQGFSLASTLFFNGQRYRVKASKRAGDAPAFDLQFEPQASATGELQISGKMVNRVLLVGQHQGQPITVLLIDPGERVNIPVGTYNECRYVLAANSVKAIPDGQRYGNRPARSIKIEANKPALLTSGGPLTNMVGVSRSGAHLTMNYSLVGAENQRYELVGARPQPQFKVFLGEKQLASGKFEYG